MEQRSFLPDTNRIGVLAAAVLLTFALGHLIPSTAVDLRLTLGPLSLTLPVDLGVLLTVLAAGLTATGMDWLLRGHPELGKRPTWEHYLLPTLTVLVIGVPLGTIPPGPAWWVAFGLAGALIVIVFLAEYVAVNPAASSYAVATGLLTALSFSVYLILLVSIDSTQPRLVILLPAVFVGSALVALRTLRLRGQWEIFWATGIALVSIQLTAALHYWPIRSLPFGLAVFGPLYALTSLAGNAGEGTPLRRAWLEPVSVLALAWATAFFLR